MKRTLAGWAVYYTGRPGYTVSDLFLIFLREGDLPGVSSDLEKATLFTEDVAGFTAKTYGPLAGARYENAVIVPIFEQTMRVVGDPEEKKTADFVKCMQDSRVNYKRASHK
jgi:hypothetical protein